MGCLGGGGGGVLAGGVGLWAAAAAAAAGAGALWDSAKLLQGGCHDQCSNATMCNSREP